MLVAVDKPTYYRGWLRLIQRPASPASATIINSWIVGDADRTASKWDDGQMVDDTVVIVTLLPGEGSEALPVDVRPEDIEDALRLAMREDIEDALRLMSEHSVQCRDCTAATDAAGLCKDGFAKLAMVFKLRGMLDQAEKAEEGRAGSSEAPQGRAGSSEAPQGRAGSSEAPQGQAGSSEAPQGQAGSSEAPQGQAGSSGSSAGQ